MDECPAHLLLEWMEYDAISPIIATEANLIGHATTAAVIANVNRDSKKRSEPFTPMDFVPSFMKSDVPDTAPEEKIVSAFKMLKAQMEVKANEK